MYCPTYVVSFVQFCSIFEFLHPLNWAVKQVEDAIDNNQKSVIQNCGMWVRDKNVMQETETTLRFRR